LLSTGKGGEGEAEEGKSGRYVGTMMRQKMAEEAARKKKEDKGPEVVAMVLRSTSVACSVAAGLSAAVEKRLLKGAFAQVLLVLKHEYLYIYNDQHSFVSNQKHLDVFWLNFCRLREVHPPGKEEAYLVAIYDIRLDKICMLRFDTGLEREEWLQALLKVQDSVRKGLLAIRTFGKNADEQKQQALELLQQRSKDNAGIDIGYHSTLSDGERCRMVLAYGQELDEAHGLTGYDFCIVMPYQFVGRSKAWVAKRHAAQREIIQVLRAEHLVCRIVKSRDEDELLLLVRAPTYEEFALMKNKRKKAADASKPSDRDKAKIKTSSALPTPSPELMDWCCSTSRATQSLSSLQLPPNLQAPSPTPAISALEPQH
jgi:hypothetical protein